MPGGVPGFICSVFSRSTLSKRPVKSFSSIRATNRSGTSISTCPFGSSEAVWYGESVGHYEGDTLVVDTIGMNDKTFIDAYRTPHTEKLHVVERFRMVDGGKAMQVDITLDDPDAFNAPWSLTQRYDRVQQPFVERICAETISIVRLSHSRGHKGGLLSEAATNRHRALAAFPKSVIGRMVIKNRYYEMIIYGIVGHGDRPSSSRGRGYRVFAGCEI